MPTVDELNARARRFLPGHLGILITRAEPDETRTEMPVREVHLAPNGFMHAGSVVTLADTTAGHGCIMNLPPGANFTTIELKCNHLGTAREGTIECVATPVHRGRTTQVWDAVVTHRETGRTLALFRCTQMILLPREGTATGG